MVLVNKAVNCAFRYLNEFRTTQCSLFLEQQCQFHRPYTCFYWHFPNQKRRQPIKRADGTFNYNPDVYCDKYDENSGTCPNGEDCPYAHRNAGDTERRYHPRYFKTGCCIYETTDNGSCVKNGLHCAFAHGPDDVRTPVYDIREVQDSSLRYTVNLPASLEKERVLAEDPKWNDMFHVLSCYKTELCKKPPRMCRQGYSCPFFHNGKDKRRAPDKFRYKSTPCPNVRPVDEWLDSALCEHGDNCLFCHTRTEQQFHPEIYNSSKCNDVINSGYCPRGPFCAFAHVDAEMNIGREYLQTKQQQQQQQQQQQVGKTGLSSPGGMRDAQQMAAIRLALMAHQQNSSEGKRLADQLLKSTGMSPQAVEDLAMMCLNSENTFFPQSTQLSSASSARPTNLMMNKQEVQHFLSQQMRRNHSGLSPVSVHSPAGQPPQGYPMKGARTHSGGSNASTSGKGSSVSSNAGPSKSVASTSRIKSSGGPVPMPAWPRAPAPLMESSLTKNSPVGLMIDTDFREPRRPSEVINAEQEEMVLNYLNACLTPTALLHSVENPLKTEEEILKREQLMNAAFRLLSIGDTKFNHGDSPSMEEHLWGSGGHLADSFSFTGNVGSNRTSGVFDEAGSYFTLNEFEHGDGMRGSNYVSRAPQLSPTASSVESGPVGSSTEPVAIPERRAGNFGPIGSGSTRSLGLRPNSMAETQAGKVLTSLCVLLTE
ncbi:hypothetical protein Ciccas_001790 [Cichlidogyrus casuarinus]|uniref:C3H1-type domain-containing protein n=1 Tax=Cichlidogyrus casuarinus TaxID=1844966 RepID=A0ABD2QJ49_9PLAT